MDTTTKQEPVVFHDPHGQTLALIRAIIQLGAPVIIYENGIKVFDATAPASVPHVNVWD